MKNIAKNCAIIPAHNEEENIVEVVKKTKKSNLIPIVVDDNSEDRTRELAKRSGAIVLRRTSNKGKGEAIKAGIEYILEKLPKVRNLVFIDADMQYHPEEAQKLVRPLERGEADIVTGFRDWSVVPFRHRLGNFVWRTGFNILFGTNLKDTNCGFMSMTKKSAELVKDSLGGGYIIENALLSYAIQKNLIIKQVPVRVTYKHKSEVKRGIRMVAGIFLFIIKEGLRYRFGKKK